jgi:hypothetical protein
VHDESLIKDLYSDFNKEEILSIAKELKIPAELTDHTKVVIGNILDFAIENHPNFQKVSDTTAEFLVAAGICDEDGNYLTIKEPEPEKIEEDITLPECYGMADRTDPACVKCRVLEQCAIQRIKSRPPCFGKYWDGNDELCKICLEEQDCSEIVKKGRG